jgi:predicted O-methyltransferase YrrM
MIVRHPEAQQRRAKSRHERPFPRRGSLPRFRCGSTSFVDHSSHLVRGSLALLKTQAILHATLSELGRGSIVTIDVEWARQEKPNIEELLDRIGERHRVTVFYEPTSYTWRMMRFLEEDPAPRFDLCYLDGAHTWFVDALAFFLADRLLRPGGWIIFDDLDWTVATSPSRKESKGPRSMPLDEQTTLQVERIYELLVKPHPSYHNFRVEDGWAFAQKRDAKDMSTQPEQREIVTEQVVRVERVQVGLGAFLMRVANKFRGK